jgi:hypothetical protein
MTSGMLIASHIRVRFEGVCAHPADFDAREVVERVVLVGVDGGDSTFVKLVLFAVELRVVRLRGELS